MKVVTVVTLPTVVTIAVVTAETVETVLTVLTVVTVMIENFCNRKKWLKKPICDEKLICDGNCFVMKSFLVNKILWWAKLCKGQQFVIIDEKS